MGRKIYYIHYAFFFISCFKMRERHKIGAGLERKYYCYIQIKHNPHYRKYEFTEFDRYILMRIWRILAIKYYPLEMAKNTLKRHFLI